MKNWVMIAAFGMALSALVPVAQAQDNMQELTQEQKLGMSDAQFRNVLRQAIIQRDLAAGDADDAIFTADGVTNLSGASEKEAKTVFRYDDRDSGGVFYGAELPKRTFNNIGYPY